MGLSHRSANGEGDGWSQHTQFLPPEKSTLPDSCEQSDLLPRCTASPVFWFIYSFIYILVCIRPEVTSMCNMQT